MEYVKGIIIIHTKAGMASVKSSNGICLARKLPKDRAYGFRSRDYSLELCHTQWNADQHRHQNTNQDSTRDIAK